MEGIRDAREVFTLFELGAGYGYWAVAGACAARSRNLVPHLLAIEGEPTHFEWLHKNFRDNGLEPAAHRLIHGAVTDHDGEAVFGYDDNPAVQYGDGVAPREGYGHPDRKFLRVPSYSIATLLRDYERVDLVDCDIQEAELTAIPAGLDAMTAKVARAYIGTHTGEIEAVLRNAFRAHGWQCVYDFGCRTSAATPLGEIRFEDGVQYWVNPKVLTA